MVWPKYNTKPTIKTDVVMSPERGLHRPLTALLTAILRLASPPKRLAMVLEMGTYAMGITSMGTPFFHC